MFKFSIVVPVYNCDNYIEECIASVFAQTYTNFELVLIDDGSTDKSAVICDNCSLHHVGKVVVKHNTNHGPYFSRLHGIDVSSGDVIVFLDSDDCLRKDALELLDSYFTNYSCDMVIYNTQPCDSFPSMRITHPFEQTTLFEGDSKKDLYRILIGTRSLNSIVLKAVKRQYAQPPDSVPEDCRLKHGEDLLLSASFITSSPRILCINDGLYHYRSSPGSITHTYSTELNFSLKIVHNTFDKLINFWKMPDLIRVHNARKVRGWMDSMTMMINPSSNFPIRAMLTSLEKMASDFYFISAYQNMDKKYLSVYYRVLAMLLHQKHFYGLIVLHKAKTIVTTLLKKVFWWKYDR